MRSIYIHIPFCNSICSYCDFCKMLYNPNWADSYLNVLNEEIDKYYDNSVVDTIYIGGGTPSSLSIEQLTKLFNIIKKIKTTEDFEFTFEINIDDVRNDILEILKNNGVNRLSIGVESTDKYKLQYLNRKHSKKQISNNIKLIRKYGFSNINVDFMYALPIESYHKMKVDLNNILKLKPEHISTYSLIIENNTALSIRNTKPLSEDIESKMYKYICKKLKKKNYKHYEVSNFALPGNESKHNLKYWNNEEYYGFGLGASGYIDGVRYENTRSLNDYLKNKYRKEELFVSKKEEMENELILGLRKLEGVNLKKFYEKFNVMIQDVFDFDKVIEMNLIEINGEYLKIKEENIYIMNEIINMIIK